MNWEVVLPWLLPGGITAVVVAGWNAWRELKSGTRLREREAITDLAKWRETADDARAWEALQHQYWREWAGILEYRLARVTGDNVERPPYPENPANLIRRKALGDE